MQESSIVTVRLFAAVRETVGRSTVSLEAAGIRNAGELRSELVRLYPRVAPLLSGSALAVNLTYVDDGHPIRPGDEVAVIPPVAGG
jgi:molybdopterin converting factor subunit 1